MYGQYILIIGTALFIIVSILYLTQKKHIQQKYSVLWIMIGLLLLAMPFMSHLYQWAIELLHISNPSSFYLFFSTLGLACMCLQLTVAASTAKKKIKASAQEIALLETRVKTLEKTMQSKTKDD